MITVINFSLFLFGCIKQTTPLPLEAEQQTNETTIPSSEEVASSPQSSAEPNHPTLPVGTFDKSLIDAEIKKHMNELMSCYSKSLTKNPALSGRLMIDFVIEKDGTVSNANASQDTLGSDTFTACILAEFEKMQFPAGMKSDTVKEHEPSEERKVRVSYPLLFTPE